MGNDKKVTTGHGTAVPSEQELRAHLGEITAGGANNTFETYDTLGRQVFAAFTAKF